MRQPSQSVWAEGQPVRYTLTRCIWIALLVTFSAPVSGAVQALSDGTLSVLGVAFPHLPLRWQEEPYAPFGAWLEVLGVQGTPQKDSLTLRFPDRSAVTWTTNTTQLTLNDRTLSVAPLQVEDDRLWVPLVSLAALLGLRPVVNADQRQIKLVTELRQVTLTATRAGWLLETVLSYPLAVPPRVGTLSDPYRAYVDFVGASATLDPTALPSGTQVITQVRLGQFSSDPPIARLVVDADAALTVSVVGRQRSGKGERWCFLLQLSASRQPWLGQVTFVENTPTRATLQLRGWFGTMPRLAQEPHRLVVEVPVTPLLPPSFPDCPPDGVVREAVATVTERGTRIVLTLRSPAHGQWRLQEEDSILLVVEAPPRSVRTGRLIIVDAGHGGKDPGAQSPFGIPPEKHLTLDIAQRLRRLLEQAGYSVRMTRETDVYISLADRVAMANALGADAFVSVHLNSFPRPGGQWGTEVYYWTPHSLPLAEAVYRNLLSLLGRKGNGVRQRRLYVVRHTVMPAILVEPCYVNHPDEAALLKDESFRERIALAICQGIMEFFNDVRRLERGLEALPESVSR